MKLDLFELLECAFVFFIFLFESDVLFFFDELLPRDGSFLNTDQAVKAFGYTWQDWLDDEITTHTLCILNLLTLSSQSCNRQRDGYTCQQHPQSAEARV